MGAADALCVVPLGTKPTGAVSCPETRSCGTPCAANKKVVAHFCVDCEAGKTNAAGDGTAGADTTCDTTMCAANEKVVAHLCVACEAGKINAAGDGAAGADTTCDIDLNDNDAAGQRAQQSAAPTVVPAIGLVTGMLAALQLWV